MIPTRSNGSFFPHLKFSFPKFSPRVSRENRSRCAERDSLFCQNKYVVIRFLVSPVAYRSQIHPSICSEKTSPTICCGTSHACGSSENSAESPLENPPRSPWLISSLWEGLDSGTVLQKVLNSAVTERVFKISWFSTCRKPRSAQS